MSGGCGLGVALGTVEGDEVTMLGLMGRAGVRSWWFITMGLAWSSRGVVSFGGTRSGLRVLSWRIMVAVTEIESELDFLDGLGRELRGGWVGIGGWFSLER